MQEIDDNKKFITFPQKTDTAIWSYLSRPTANFVSWVNKQTQTYPKNPLVRILKIFANFEAVEIDFLLHISSTNMMIIGHIPSPKMNKNLVGTVLGYKGWLRLSSKQ